MRTRRISIVWKRLFVKRLSWQHQLFLFLQIGAALWTLYLWVHLPTPGKAVAILAGVAAAMSIHGEMRSWQKFIWMVLIGVLLKIELRAINADRAMSQQQSNQDRITQDTKFGQVLKTENQNFQAIANGLKETIRISSHQFVVTSEANKRIIEKTMEINHISQESLANITGGSSFLVFIPREKDSGLLLSQGSSNLHSVAMRILDVPVFEEFMKQHPDSTLSEVNRQYVDIQIGELPRDMARQIAIPPLQRHGDLIRLNIFFSASNGFWIENYVRRYVGGLVKVALRVIRDKGVNDPRSIEQKVIYEKVDKDFPKDAAGKPRWE